MFYGILVRMDQHIEQAVDILKSGGLVAFPTDTVYGLGASCLDETAVARVFEAKGRPRHLALPLLLSHVAQIERVAQVTPDVAWRLAERFLPGGLTLVLRKAPWLSSVLTGGGDKIAVRVPNHPVPIALIQGLGAPITGTSANITGNPSVFTAEEVHRQMGDRVEFTINGGRCPGEAESTVLDLTEKTPRILRQGAVPREAIEEICATSIN